MVVSSRWRRGLQEGTARYKQKEFDEKSQDIFCSVFFPMISKCLVSFISFATNLEDLEETNEARTLVHRKFLGKMSIIYRTPQWSFAMVFTRSLQRLDSMGSKKIQRGPEFLLRSSFFLFTDEVF